MSQNKVYEGRTFPVANLYVILLRKNTKETTNDQIYQLQFADMSLKEKIMKHVICEIFRAILASEKWCEKKTLLI